MNYEAEMIQSFWTDQIKSVRNVHLNTWYTCLKADDQKYPGRRSTFSCSMFASEKIFIYSKISMFYIFLF